MTATPLRRTPRSGLERLVEQSGKTVAKRQRTTVASRKAALDGDLKNFSDRLEAFEGVVALQEKMAGFVELITQKTLGTDLVLDESQALILMTQALARRDISEFMSVCWDHIKDIAFSHLNALYAEDPSIENPENTNGEIPVPALGMKFARESCGRNDPTVNEDMLRVVLGDRWKEVYESRVIPEHTEYELSLEKLVTLALNDPSVHDQIISAIEPGTWKSPRLVMRPL